MSPPDHATSAPFRTPPGPALVGALDTTRPLALFPVRLATRFHRPRAGAAPDELRVRIFPDLLHADGHLPGLTSEEIAIGEAYWTRLWRAGHDPAARDDAHRWAVTQLGAPRTAWVARRTAPENPEAAPRRPVPAGRPLEPAPVFPRRRARTETRPALARMLPDRWCVIARRSVEFVQRVWSRPVRRDLALAPNLAEIDREGGARELLRGQDLWWMVDFHEAEAAGMAVRLPWDPQIRPRYITELLVFGVRGDNRGAAEELQALLEAHRHTEGLELLPQGTPTNNTDAARAGFSETPEDLDGYLRRQLAEVAPKRPALKPASRLGTVTNANALSIVLGLEGTNAFDRTEHAGLRSATWARNMNRALWPATLGYLVTELLASGGTAPMSVRERRWLRDWFRDWVRGPGFLPVFRVGSQPFGLLPVVRRPELSAELGATRVGGLYRVLLELRGAWSAALANVAHFCATPEAPPPTPEEEAERLAAVLGAVPHPTGIRLREAGPRYAEIAARWRAELAELERLLDHAPYGLSALYDGTLYEDRLDGTIAGGELREQSLALSRLRDTAQRMLETAGDPAPVEAVRKHLDEVLRPLTAAHEIRTQTRGLSERFSPATLPTAGDPPLWYLEYGDDGAREDGTFPRLRIAPPAEDAARFAERLRGYAAGLRAGPRAIAPRGRPASLLEKLVQYAVETVPDGEAEDLARALEGLAVVAGGTAVADPMAELERLTRETLGLVTHRYDAWVSSVAHQRLARLRAAQPAGLQVGGYGWVLNLAPDEGGIDSQGFIHAPSLDHAATAAVLRSAWLNFSNDAQDAVFSVDLTSDRVRRAHWLLDGVRNGVDLAELLGGRFERRLHDRGLSHLVAGVRERVLAATGHGERPASAIVDGLALAVAYGASASGDPVREALEPWRESLGEAGKALLAPLQDTVADLDATSDLLTAQAVHSVIKGSLAEAAATLSVAGAGSAGIPQLRLPSVHRESRLVEHRVLAVLPPSPPAAAPTLLAVAEPGLAAWLNALLPALDGVMVKVDLVEAEGSRSWAGTLGGLGLTPIEVVAAAAAGGDLAASRLGALLAARARLETGLGPGAEVRFGVQGGDGPALADLAVAAGALQGAIGAARPLRGEDLSSEPAGGPDLAELDARRLALAGALEALAASESGEWLLRERMADLTAVDPEGLAAALSSQGERPARIEALLARAAAAAEALRAPMPDEFGSQRPQARARYLEERMGRALGLKVPVLPRCAVTGAGELAAGFAATPERVATPVDAMAWLLEAGRVHPGAGRLAEALDLIEAVHPNAPVPLQVAQLPEVAGEPWVANRAPAGEGSRLHLFSVTGAAEALAQGPVCGLIFDAWSEPIPGHGQTTGLAVHFDRPGAQPPQSVLLAVPPEDGPWTVEEIETMLVQTIELAQMRTVGPETLPGWGHTLPAAYLPAGAAVETVDGPEAAS